MELYVNDVQTDQIRREGVYLVAPIRFLKSMRLHRGYVPKREVVNATDKWAKTPVVLGHPTDDRGRPISVNDDRADTPVVGFIDRPETHVNGAAVTEGELWYSLERARELGGVAEKIAANLEAGVSHPVSSAYAGSRLPPGPYDGKHRDRVMGRLRPDHVAILESNRGRCKLEDGCMAGGEIAANAVFPNAMPDSDSGANLEEAQALDLVDGLLDEYDTGGVPAVEAASVPDEYERVKDLTLDKLRSREQAIWAERLAEAEGYDPTNLKQASYSVVRKLAHSVDPALVIGESEVSANVRFDPESDFPSLSAGGRITELNGGNK